MWTLCLFLIPEAASARDDFLCFFVMAAEARSVLTHQFSLLIVKIAALVFDLRRIISFFVSRADAPLD